MGQLADQKDGIKRLGEPAVHTARPLTEVVLVRGMTAHGKDLQAGIRGVTPDFTGGGCYVRRFREQWSWFSYFFNALAARTFLVLDLSKLEAVDEVRREWVVHWLENRSLPAVSTGSYYVKSFALVGSVPAPLQPLTRDGIVRVCFKPPQLEV